MTFDQLFEQRRAAGVSLAGRTVAFDFGEAGSFHTSRSGGGVARGIGAPDCTFWMSIDDCDRLHHGRLDTDAAFIDGRIKAKGDLAAALEYVGLFPLRED